MSSSLNVILNGATVQVVNTIDSTTRVNSSVGNPTLGAADAGYATFYPITTGGVGLPLFSTNIWVLYIRNLGGINGTPAGNITVRVQAVGGALPSAADSVILPPGGVYMYWNTAETAGGVASVTLVASVNNTPVEYLVAA